MTNKKRLINCVLYTLLLGIFLTGCGTQKQQNQVDLLESAVSVNAPQQETEDVVIGTAYGDLHYPDQWTEFVKTEQIENDDSIVVTFEAEINGKRYPLFKTTIGGENGDLAGTITDSAGTIRNVYIYVEELPEDPELTEEEQNRLYAMQEDLNYLIDSLE